MENLTESEMSQYFPLSHDFMMSISKAFNRESHETTWIYTIRNHCLAIEKRLLPKTIIYIDNKATMESLRANRKQRLLAYLKRRMTLRGIQQN